MENKIDICSFFLDNKRDEKINESLLSLRIMKQIDDYLEQHDKTNRCFAEELRCSESYISQLMSGNKNVNVSFLNKIERLYNVYFEIKLINNSVVQPVMEKKEEIWTYNYNLGSLEFKSNMELSLNVKTDSFVSYEEVK
ncbi:helix-turn-helix domain-containing protein [Myroides odoratimimus]|uniref:helix-turn-helix domain-containing protein n=1 Tax=Myroides odoratimimus TaxID=76832 RepID=UPI0038D43EA9